MMNKNTLVVGLCGLILSLTGCQKNEPPSTAPVTTVVNPDKAVANLSPASGSSVKGTVTFTKAPAGVHVEAKVTGLTPGEHGFHVHEKGDCSAPDASSAGGHYNPTGKPHGAPDAEMHHVGDLGNITANAQGVAELSESFSFLSLAGAHSIVGMAVVVHGGKDDLVSQPSGDAGPRVACGVIEVQP